MAELIFSQSERRSYLIPGLIAIAVLAAFLGFMYLRTPLHIASGAVTHTNILPTHTVFKTETKLVGAQELAQDDLYVAATVRIDNHLKIPLFLSDFNGTLINADDTSATTNAVQKNDIPNVFLSFPALKPLAGPPLLRESSIQPGSSAEGMVLLHFPVTEAEWNSRKSATITIDFYHQGSLTLTIPK